MVKLERGRHRREGPRRAGPDDRRRSATSGKFYRDARDEGHAGGAPALRRVDEADHRHRQHRQAPTRREPVPVRGRGAAPPPARGRLSRSRTLEMILQPMVEDGKEAIGSMGDDTPLAVLSGPVSRPAPLLPPELQPGHQPADRQPARDAGDDAEDAARQSRQHARRGRRRSATCCSSTARCCPPPSSRRCADYMGETACDGRLHLRRWRTARRGLRDGARAHPPRGGGGACAPAARMSILTDEHQGPERAPIPMILATGARAYASGAPVAAHLHLLNVRSARVPGRALLRRADRRRRRPR